MSFGREAYKSVAIRTFAASFAAVPFAESALAQAPLEPPAVESAAEPHLTVRCTPEGRQVTTNERQAAGGPSRYTDNGASIALAIIDFVLNKLRRRETSASFVGCTKADFDVALAFSRIVNPADQSESAMRERARFGDYILEAGRTQRLQWAPPRDEMVCRGDERGRAAGQRILEHIDGTPDPDRLEELMVTQCSPAMLQAARDVLRENRDRRSEVEIRIIDQALSAIQELIVRRST